MSHITITNPPMRWLFSGFGFHNSEATMSALMSEKFKNEVAVKAFREISPTFSRVFAVYADWTKEAMDDFADYYDLTFRKAGTILYAVPGRLPYITDEDNIDEYCEKIAEKLDYLINERNCVKIRYYCVTNELSVGNTYCWFADHMDLFKQYHESLYKAFRRHNLNVGLLATDVSGAENFGQIDWAIQNMDEITYAYCAHLYNFNRETPPGSLKAYEYYMSLFEPTVESARRKEKRFILGECGIKTLKPLSSSPMGNDSQFAIDYPHLENIFALSFAELAMAVVNSGCFAGAYWTMLDYPDPFICEDGDTAEEKARYNAARFSGHGLEFRYNKNGLIRWCDEQKDYRSHASLYTLGYMAKFFKKGTRVFDAKWDDENVRCCAVSTDEGAVSVALLNWKDEAVETQLSLEYNCKQPARMYVYEADNVPYNDFNDLQPYSGLVDLNEENLTVTLPPKSFVILTTDYVDRVPSKVTGVRVNKNTLTWNASPDSEHCYYRVFADEKQIASTVAHYTEIADKTAKYEVKSVDKWGNVR